MTLQERLREAGLDLSARGWRDSCGSPDCGIASNLANEAALALDAQEKRIKELEGGLRDFLAWDDGSHDGSPAAHHDSAIARARALMGEK